MYYGPYGTRHDDSLDDETVMFQSNRDSLNRHCLFAGASCPRNSRLYSPAVHPKGTSLAMASFGTPNERTGMKFYYGKMGETIVNQDRTIPNINVIFFCLNVPKLNDRMVF